MSYFGLSPRTHASQPVPIQRVRARFSRTGPAAQLSHLQQIDALRRAVEKSSWPVAPLGGLSKKTKLKIAFGPAISVGYKSDAEYCDIELTARLDLKTCKADLQPHLPEGYSLLDVKSIPRFFPSLEKSLNVAAYEIQSSLLVDTAEKWEKMWAGKSFIVIKKKGDGDVAIDARPLIFSWKLNAEQLTLVLRFGPGRTLKPERIVQAVCGLNDDDVAMGTGREKVQIKKTQMYFEKQNGELAEL